MSLCFAYYCSGHGYGHATRVSAFASSLLSLSNSISVHIVSSAPSHVFADSIKLGAQYRYAEIDPVVVQPVAYRVDRQKSVEILKAFLDKKEQKLAEEVRWLRRIQANAVLSDAAFLAFLAANKAHLPSILVTNFTFDSVYSYLSAMFVCQSPATDMHVDPMSFPPTAIGNDNPISNEQLIPLVSQLQDGYRKADLLLRLPGAIPIPGFARDAALPASDWIDPSSMTFSLPIQKHIIQDPLNWNLLPSIPFEPSCPSTEPIDKPIPRMAKSAPLLVRQTNPDVYTPSGRSRILSSVGVPPHLHDASKTKILVVSFGGQVINKPNHSRNSSRQHSISHTPRMYDITNTAVPTKTPKGLALSMPCSDASLHDLFSHTLSKSLRGLAIKQDSPTHPSTDTTVTVTKPIANGVSIVKTTSSPARPKPHRSSSATRIIIPGAPAPASISSPNPSLATPTRTPSIPIVSTSPPTPTRVSYFSPGIGDYISSPTQAFINGVGELDEDDVAESLLLPDESWIAIVCGVSDSKGWGSSRPTPAMSRTTTSTEEQTMGYVNGATGLDHLMPPLREIEDDEDEDGLPAGFYIAPKNIYMPDLMAVGDVLLGKLGYGTVAECVESCTPFIYVSRPLFIEEHGLRLLLDHEGVGVEMKREEYEAGDWAGKVAAAWEKGGQRKVERRMGKHVVDRVGQTKEMAEFVVQWTKQWGGGDFSV